MSIILSIPGGNALIFFAGCILFPSKLTTGKFCCQSVLE